MGTSENGIQKMFRFNSMIDNRSVHLRQPTGFFRPSDLMAFSACPMERPGKASEFHFSAPRDHFNRYHSKIQVDTVSNQL
jgi:hypothetical protein